MDSVFFIFEMIGVVAFALSGAMLATKCGMDILGVCVLGVTTACGGGIMRDLLLGIHPPAMLQNPFPALVAIGISVFPFLPFMKRFLSDGKHRVYDFAMLIADSIGLGIFTVMGVNVCYEAVKKPHLFMAVFLGVITGVGGGVLRDVMSQNKPYIFVKHFYACASLIGAMVCVLLRDWLGELIAMIVGMSVIILLRILAAIFRWKLPKVEAAKKQ